MNRRELLVLVGSAIAVAGPLHAQQKAPPVIGFLGAASPDWLAPYVAGFRQGLRETGYIEGQNLAIEYRFLRRATTSGCRHWPPNSSPAREAAGVKGLRLEILKAGTEVRSTLSLLISFNMSTRSSSATPSSTAGASRS
jgi:hypothetical protein